LLTPPRFLACGFVIDGRRRCHFQAQERLLRPVSRELESWLAGLDEASPAEGGPEVP